MLNVFLYKRHYDICHNIIQYAVTFLPTLNQTFCFCIRSKAG